MKFHQVGIGEDFTYKGEAYRKVSPLIAHHSKDGQQKMFRRADSVSLVTDKPESEPGQSDQPDTALKQLYQACSDILEKQIADKKNRLQAQEQLLQEYNRLINKLS